MTAATPTRIGQINGSGDPLALFLKTFAGEVLVSFIRQAHFRDKHIVRTIASGKSAQFPATGTIGAFYHTPGAEILGSSINDAERVINVEGQLISAAFLANIDEAMAHFDYRGPVADQIAAALSKVYDQNVARAIINAARASATVTGNPGGYTITNANAGVDGSTLFNMIFDAGVRLDENDAPQVDRFGIVRPAQYALLVKSEKGIHRDTSGGDNGGLRKGTIYEINNIPISKTNNLPNADDTANSLMPATRQHDYSVTQGLVFQKGAAGTVALQDVTMESQYDMRRQGHLMLGKYITGHDVLRPEVAVELRTAAPAS